MNYFSLTNTPLFHGIREDELREMLTCLNAREQEYKKGDVIFRAGESVTEVGLVERGSVNIVVNFYWGNSGTFGQQVRLLLAPRDQWDGHDPFCP